VIGELRRCAWARKPLALAYHDKEWGVPVRRDRKLFEFLILEGAQAGLSWDTILAKRAGYRRAFHCFDPKAVSRYRAADRKRLLADSGIVRNRAKIDAAIANARLFLEVQREFGSFSKYAWSFVGGRPLQPRRRRLGDIPARSEVSDALSADLKQRGFKFVGTTIMYAFMQAVGMVNDHETGCFRYAQLAT
jgi:DNA-3-methyladenine glycosylase I